MSIKFHCSLNNPIVNPFLACTTGLECIFNLEAELCLSHSDDRYNIKTTFLPGIQIFSDSIAVASPVQESQLFVVAFLNFGIVQQEDLGVSDLCRL